MKTQLQQLIRRVHLALCCGALPQRLAIYLHSVGRRELAAFAEAIAFFREQGYEFCGPDAICARGTGKSVFLSFDDNFRSWLEVAEILRRHGVSATFYVNSCVIQPRASGAEVAAYYDRIGNPRDQTPLSAADLTALAAAGHTIASHGHSHQMLSRLPQAQAEEDIRRGKLELEDLLGRPVEHFSFPYGQRRHFRESLRRYCFQIGFRSVAAAIPGMQHCRQSPACIHRSPWRLDRTLQYNLENLRIDGSLFQALTGRSAVG